MAKVGMSRCEAEHQHRDLGAMQRDELLFRESAVRGRGGSISYRNGARDPGERSSLDVRAAAEMQDQSAGTITMSPLHIPLASTTPCIPSV